MVEWIVSSSVLIAVLILLRFVLKGKISLRLQYALWAVVLVRLLVPVSFGDTAMSVGNLTQKAAESEPVQFVSALSETELPRMTYQAAYNEVAKEYADRGIQIEEMPLEEYAETVDYEIMNKMNGDLSIAEVVKIIWISGIALVGVWFLLSNLRLYLSLKKTRTLLSDSHALPVYLSDAIDTPCLFGLFHPAIYLTSEAIESEHTQRHAVEHELTHFHHKDNIWAILRSVCLAVHWFNPLVWCAAVLSRNDAELACDESTILRLGEDERAAYGRTLIHLTCEKRPALLNTATTMTGSGKSIKERIALIVKKPKMALYTLIAVVVIVATVVGCTFTGAKKTNTPWNWAQNLTSEDIASVELWSDKGNVSLTDGERADFVRILNALEMKDFTENTQLTGGTPTYGLTVQTANGEYHINESIAPSGSLEMVGYGDKQWWIDNDALAEFIRTLLEQSAIPTGQYASVEEYIVQQAVGKDTVSLMMWEIPSTELSDEEYEATVVDRKLGFLKHYGSLEGLSPDGTLEAWGYEWLIKPDTSEINPEHIVLAGGQYMDEDGYICFTNGQIVVALHYPDGSYDILGEEPHGDGIDFFGYHNSTEESIYDWYVKKYNLDLPLYVEDWIDLITVPEGGRLGNYPVHRFDGDGWYIYIPIDSWTTPVRNSAGNYEIYSQYDTGSHIIVGKNSANEEQTRAHYLDLGHEITEVGLVKQHDGETHCVYLYPANDGGCYVLHTFWYDEGITDYPYIAMEPDVMRLVAESFTVDERIVSHATENEAADITGITSATLEWNGTHTVTDSDDLRKLEGWFSNSKEVSEGTGCPFTALLTLELMGNETKTISIATDNCSAWMSEGVCYQFRTADSAEFFALFGTVPIDDTADATDDTSRWEDEIVLYGFSVKTEGNMEEIGQTWAGVFVEQYLSAALDNPRHSKDVAVFKCTPYASSLLSSPKRLIYFMSFVCDASDPEAFMRSFAGWAEPLSDAEYPQYDGWMNFGWFVELELTDDNTWTCVDAGTGGYGGWGYLNYEEIEEVDFRMENTLKDVDGHLPENLIRVLPFVDWRAFDVDNWDRLYQFIDQYCLTEGQVYGPEETRMWKDVYPDDQAYRNLYVMLAALNSDGAYAEGLGDILSKQYAYDTATFTSCMENSLTADQRAIILSLLR